MLFYYCTNAYKGYQILIIQVEVESIKLRMYVWRNPIFFFI